MPRRCPSTGGCLPPSAWSCCCPGSVTDGPAVLCPLTPTLPFHLVLTGVGAHPCPVPNPPRGTHGLHHVTGVTNMLSMRDSSSYPKTCPLDDPLGIQLLSSSHRWGDKDAEHLAACLRSLGPDLCTACGQAQPASILGHGLGPYFAEIEAETQGAGRRQSQAPCTCRRFPRVYLGKVRRGLL